MGAGVGVVASSQEVRLSEMQFAISFDDAAQDIAKSSKSCTYEKGTGVKLTPQTHADLGVCVESVPFCDVHDLLLLIAQHIRKIRATYEPPGSATAADHEVAEFEIQRTMGGGSAGGGHIREVRTMSPGRTLQRSRSNSPSQTVLDANGHMTSLPVGSQEERLATFEQR